MRLSFPSVWLSLALAAATAGPVCAQSFIGTNSPGQGSNYSLSVGAGATNLSLVVSNNSTAYSYLLLKKGGTPTDTDFDFVSRVDGQTNQINLQLPEYAAGSYGLRVSTPGASAAQGFQVVMTTNRVDLRTPGYPVLKPLAFTTTGSMTNSGAGAWNYFQVDVPSNLLTGWRVVLSSSSATAPGLFLRRGLLPNQFSYDKALQGPQVDTIMFTSAEATTGTYFIGVYLPAGPNSSASYALSAELSSVVTLTWDPGTDDFGTATYTNTSTSGGEYYFKITTQTAANGVWRNALRVLGGEADLYLLYGSLAQTNSYNYASARAGSDGMVLAEGAYWNPGQDWYLTVHATPGAQWTLLTGEAYIQQLPALAADASSGTNATIGPEGMRFFKTTISPGTLAWRLGLNGLTNTVLVHNSKAPVLVSSPGAGYFDWIGNGQMLLVPNYINIGNQYLVGVIGTPGLNFTLDSRQQAITDLPFNSLINVAATNYDYVTYRVQVPVQQIAWQINLAPTSGDPNIAVRRDNVPNESTNDAFSELSGSIGDSVTLVPPTLSDGTFYITVYGGGPFSCSMTNGQPIITDVHYVFQITNDVPARAGWRFYRVVNVAEQLGTYGWDLELSNFVAGTEIALRRNAVPGRWNYRSCNFTCNYNATAGFVDYSGTGGFLQRPGHQADIWYIGVYQPNSALGSFTLSGQELTATPLSFDGGGASKSITNQPAGRWQYFVFNVPANAMGWDLRLTNVTSGVPQLTICRDRLPYDLGNHDYNGSYWYYPYASLSWPSGYSWAAGYDWTSESVDPDGSYTYGRIHQMGMGNPLEPGTYYVGVISGGNQSPMTYTMVSRGINTNGMAIKVLDLAYNGGVVFTNGLPPREAAYYRVQIASNTPSWKMRLAATNGDSLMLVQKDFLPNVVGGSYASTAVGGGRRMQKPGDEQFLLLPDTTAQTNIPPGTYYVLVASEGQNPNGGTIGTNNSGYALYSFGPALTNQVGNVTALGPDITMPDTLQGGEVKFYQFTVSPGLLAMEVRLDSRVARPLMMLRSDGLLVQSYGGYGRDGGQSYQWYGDSIINIATPPAGTYTLSVEADTYVSGYSNAAYTVVVHPVNSTPVSFDGGALTVTGHTNGVWRFYQFDVPASTFGWDLRLTNTSGSPQLVVCRDLAPNGLFSGAYPGYGWYYPWSYTTWPSSNQWAAGYEWTGEYQDPNGTNRYGHILQMGMGNPLEPGRYYAGVYSATPTTAGTMNYTLLSRGIGTNQSIPILNLPFVGSVSGTNVLPREAVYYKVQVPAGQASWKLRLVANSNSESMMLIQKDYLPNVVGGGGSPAQIAGGRKVQKYQDEQFTQLARSGEATLTNGTYYIALASEGMNPLYATIGTNASSYTLYSFGPATTNELGLVDASGATDILFNDSLQGGDFKFYHFSVPPGTLSLEVHLDNRVANPYMTLRADDDLPTPTDGYSFSDGHGYTWGQDSLINIANPAITNYTLAVQARQFISGYSNATFTIRLHALGLTPVAFNGGASSIAGQTAGTWQYFTITVPSNAFGWDLRLTNVMSGDPRLVIRRDIPPDALYTHSDIGGGWYYPWSYTSWPSGYQWAVDYDWTSDYYSNQGSNSYGRVFACGMGNPLSPGTYNIGVLNGGGTDPMSYTLVSRGIGTNLSIPVLNLPYIGSVSSNGLPAREVAYYKVTVPPNQPNWKLRLAASSGEAMMEIQKDYLPSVTPGGSSPVQIAGGRKLQKAGNEHFLQLPPAGDSVISGGTYYIAVASEGQNPYSGYIGSNSCNFTLTSYPTLVYSNLGTLTTTETARSNSLESGEIKVWQFTVPAVATALELRLTDKIGNSYMRLGLTTNAPSGAYNYGYDFGEGASWAHDRIISIPAPTPGFYSINVQADPNTDASYALRLRLLAPADLAFDRTLSTPGLTNVATGTLEDQQRTYFRVTVPATFNGQPVLGWKLTLDHSQGGPQLRVRKDAIPLDQGYVGDSPYVTEQGVLVPPFLTTGTWYVEVQGHGASQFTLTSSVLLLERPAWDMPAIGGSVTTPGLPPAGPLFGDTGIGTNGLPLSGDQGTDLEQGKFHYYAVTVPSNNLGILRTRLDAISGDPNLYIRAGGAPTFSHYSLGDYGSSLYDRSLTGTIGSEYGNWVPLDGKYELQLTPGTWYFAVQASGNSNVRYRLLVSLGVIADLPCDGSTLIGQSLAAGDWRYYRVFVPTNSFTVWTPNFVQNLGDVLMYVRDITPPGQGGNVGDYRHWQTDSKNFGPYPVVDNPGATNLTCPPLRPGSYYYLGFRAVNDATFTVSCTTNTTVINYTNVIAFYGGGVTNTLLPNGIAKYRIDVPADARRWISTSTHSNTVWLYLEQGTVPTPAEYHWNSGGAADSGLNMQLYNSYWPWLPGYSYFLLVTNNTSLAQNFVFHMNGQNAATDDADGDGLPDAWELTYFPSIYSYDGNADPDGDGVNNREEFLESTTPTNNTSFNPRLLVTAQGGVVTRNPVGNSTLTPPKVSYPKDSSVQLTASASTGYTFLGWSGDAAGTANPLNVVMSTNKVVNAIFGIINSAGADYQFQLNLASTGGGAPDLQNIGAGNIYASETVDVCSQLVLQFPLHNGVHLQPTTGVIPTNIYTIVMLFRLDQTNGFHRLLDFKAGTSDLGLYVQDGRLYFYNAANAPTPTIPAGVYVQVVLTRDGTNVTGFVNGAQQFTFVDSSDLGVLSGANDLRFFKDDSNSDDSSGAVARIRLYAAAMPPGQVSLLDRTLCGGVPYFLRPYFFTNALQLPVTSVIPAVTYRLLASTNLSAWSGIATGTPPANSFLFIDPQATNFPRRFYRLVTP